MAVYTAHFHPDRAQVIGPAGRLHAHDVFHALAISHAVAKTTDPADAFRYVNIFLKIFDLHQFL